MKRWMISLSAALMFAAVPFGVLAATTPTPAATGAPVNKAPGQGLEISPPVIETSADPGQTVTLTIRVRNVSAGPLIASGKADDFGAGGEDGKPKLLLDESQATRYSLKYWVASVPNLTLAPQELKTATVRVAVPKNAEPGGHFGVIRFTATPPNLQGTGVALSASVGTLVLLRVSGTVTDDVKVASFQTAHNGKVGSFFEHGPVNFIVRLQNNGSVHEKAKGTIKITNMLGGATGEVKVNELGGNVLPGSVRRFEQSLDKKQLFGRYTATFSGTYLDDNHRLSATTTFWVIPWKLVLLGLVILLVLVWLLRLGIKRYNAFIIGQARKR